MRFGMKKVWEGWGDLVIDRREPARIGTLRHGHLLWRGHISDVLEPRLFDPMRVAAGLWWPRDRAWFVATEIDFAWTFVAGPIDLINQLIADRRLEARRVRFESAANRIGSP